MAQTNPLLPCCSSFDSSPSAAPALVPTLAGVGALGESSRITQVVVHPKVPGAGARRAAEPEMAARTETTANCFLFRSEKNRLVCAMRAWYTRAAPMGSLHHCSFASCQGQRGLTQGSCYQVLCLRCPGLTLGSNRDAEAHQVAVLHGVKRQQSTEMPVLAIFICAGERQALQPPKQVG